MDLGPHFRAKLAHVGAKLAILAPLGAPFGALGRHLGSKVLPRLPQEPPDPPRPQFPPIWGPFLEGFGDPKTPKLQPKWPPGPPFGRRKAAE